jgi:hypothetical protein
LISPLRRQSRSSFAAIRSTLPFRLIVLNEFTFHVLLSCCCYSTLGGFCGHRRTHRPVAAVSGVAHFAPSVAPLAQTKPARTSSSPQRTPSIPVTTRNCRCWAGVTLRARRSGRAGGALRPQRPAFAGGSEWALATRLPARTLRSDRSRRRVSVEHSGSSNLTH